MPSVSALEPWLTIAALLWGALWGSFANVLVYRVPRGESVVRPASRCPACERPLRWYENLPIVSYLALRGRCRGCRRRVPVRYLLIEVFAGLTGLALWVHVTGGARANAAWVPAASVFVLQFYFLLGLIALTAIDIERRLLPHRLTMPLIALGLISAWLYPTDGVWAGYHPAPGVMDAVVGALGGMLLIWAVFQVFLTLTGKVGIGGGDMFLLGAIGAWFGWWSLPVILLFASVQGIVVVAISLGFPRTPTQNTHDSSEEDHSGTTSDSLASDGIAFGPFLSLAAIEYIFFGNQVLYWVTGGAMGAG